MKNDFPQSVLVVEDDDMVRRLLTRHFEKGGATVHQAADAEAALSMFVNGNERFDVVVTDIHLPGRTGLDMATDLRLHAPQQPIVFVTGDVDEKLARRALATAKAGYLLKPFEFFELDAAVAQALRAANAVPEPSEMALDTSEECWLAVQRILLVAAANQAVDVAEFAKRRNRQRFDFLGTGKIAVTVILLLIGAALIGYAIIPDTSPEREVIAAPESPKPATYYVPYDQPERQRSSSTR